MVISILRDWTDIQLSQSENGNGVKCSFLGELEFPSLLAASAVRCFALFFFVLFFKVCFIKQFEILSGSFILYFILFYFKLSASPNESVSKKALD